MSAMWQWFAPIFVVIAAQAAPGAEEPPPPEAIDDSAWAPYADATAEEGATAIGADAPEHFSPFIGRTSDGAHIFSRPETIRRAGRFSGGYVEMWFDARYDDGREKKQLWRFWCDERVINFVTSIEYNLAGKIIGQLNNRDFDLRSAADHAVPDSIGNAMMQAACSG